MPITVNDIKANIYINALANKLKSEGKLQCKEKFTHVKTSRACQLAPENQDWYYIRAAAILRRIYIHKCVGQTQFQYIFGRHSDNQCTPNHAMKGSSTINRNICQDLEIMNLVKKTPEGRVLTPNGVKTLDQFAAQLK